MIISKINKPNKIFLDVIEDSALNQFISAMEQDFSVQGALMPDAHTGYSLPIGAVVKTDGVVVPSWVGYDINCGICAIPTTYNKADILNNRDIIFNSINRTIPLGYNHHKEKTKFDIPEQDNISPVMKSIIKEKNADLQLGTLGGGK